ncbi:hypothetical protein HW555_000439 [Spodoptera exigua]|uniref:MADF domain-containing protein n=1 Tax=Spodoptera exigua TaxID=7107 RepID=A0A835L9M8_SPOEX|nr:hypothetical protein HW555_000439 [Spodoptera exigua]
MDNLDVYSNRQQLHTESVTLPDLPSTSGYQRIPCEIPMREFNWDDSAVLLLIEKYQENELLWNPRHMDFKNRNKRNDAVRDIASVFNIASSEIERKLKNLSSHYFREKRKYEESKRSGSGRDDVQLPKWFAYKALSFLNDKNAPSSQDNITSQTTLLSTRTSRKRNIEREPEVDEALQLLREITSNARQRDDAAIFADYISSKLRKMDHYTMCTVQHQIQNIVYEAEMRMGSMNFDTNNTTQPLRYQNVLPGYFTGRPTTSAMSPSPSTSRSVQSDYEMQNSPDVNTSDSLLQVLENNLTENSVID